MPSLFTELRRRNVFNGGWDCTKMEQLRLTLTVNQCPLLAESSRSLTVNECPLLAVSRHSEPPATPDLGRFHLILGHLAA